MSFESEENNQLKNVFTTCDKIDRTIKSLSDDPNVLIKMDATMQEKVSHIRDKNDRIKVLLVTAYKLFDQVFELFDLEEFQAEMINLKAPVISRQILFIVSIFNELNEKINTIQQKLKRLSDAFPELNDMSSTGNIDSNQLIQRLDNFTSELLIIILVFTQEISPAINKIINHVNSIFAGKSEIKSDFEGVFSLN